MKLAIMQPYFFPYIGYFQLLNEVDTFVIYDDVNFIKNGWINRNRLLISGNPIFFTIPLKNKSPNKNINEIEINHQDFWKRKMLKSIQLNYSKTPYFKEIYPIIERIIESNEIKLSKLATKSIQAIANYLEINTLMVESSTKYNNRQFKNQARVIDICKKEKANQYINPPGGVELYDKKIFTAENILLNFIQPNQNKYPQPSNQFHPEQSIIDVLMNNGKEKTKKMLEDYSLL